MVRHTAVFSLAVLLAGGCEIVTFHGAHWNADLDSIPPRACVQRAVNAVPGASVIDMSGNRQYATWAAELPPGAYLVPIHVDYIAVPAAALTLTMTPHKTGASFVLSHGDSESMGAREEASARAVIAGIASTCGVPELGVRAHETKDSSSSLHLWAPV